LMMLGALVLVILAAAAVPFLGGSFLPELREGHFIVHMTAMPGTSMVESVRVGKLVTQELLRNPRIRTVSQQIGRAERADDTYGPHVSEIHVDLKALEGEEVEQAETEIRATLRKFPGMTCAAMTFLSERIDEILAGVRAQVVIKIFGDDLDVLDQEAKQVAQVISSTRGAVDVQVEAPPGTPAMVVRLRPERLLQFGFQPVRVLEAVQAAYQGTVVGQVYEANRVFNIAVILKPEVRDNPAIVGSLQLKNE